MSSLFISLSMGSRRSRTDYHFFGLILISLSSGWHGTGQAG